MQSIELQKFELQKNTHKSQQKMSVAQQQSCEAMFAFSKEHHNKVDTFQCRDYYFIKLSQACQGKFEH